jgi:hypothetical protein
MKNNELLNEVYVSANQRFCNITNGFWATKEAFNELTDTEKEDTKRQVMVSGIVFINYINDILWNDKKQLAEDINIFKLWTNAWFEKFWLVIYKFDESDDWKIQLYELTNPEFPGYWDFIFWRWLELFIETLLINERIKIQKESK